MTKSKYKANKEQKQLEAKGGGHSNAKPPPPAAAGSKAKKPPPTCFGCQKGAEAHKFVNGRPKWCPNPKKGVVGGLQTVVVGAVGQKDESDLEVTVHHVKGGKRPTVKAVPDTGARVSVMGTELYREKFKSSPLLRPLKMRIVAVNGSVLRQRGSFVAEVFVRGEKAKTLVAVCDKVDSLYLDLACCKSLGIVSDHFPYPDPTLKRRVNRIDGQVPIWNVSSLQKEGEGFTEEPPPPMLPSSPAPSVAWPPPEVWPQRSSWVDSLPDEATDELMSATEQKLREVYACVFDDSKELRPMRGPGIGDPMEIRLKPDAVPFCMTGVRPIPMQCAIALRQSWTIWCVVA